MSKAKKAASVMGDVARGADNASAVRALLGDLIGADAVDFTNPEVMRLLPLNLQRGVLAGDTQAIAFATQKVLSQNSARLPTATPMEGGALIPQGGRGVPVGGPTGSGVLMPESRALSTEVTPQPRLPGPPQRALPAPPEQLRLPGPAQRALPAPRSPDLPPGGSAVDFDDPALADFLRSQGQPPPPRRPAGGADFGVPERRPLPPGEPRAVGQADVLSRRRRAAGTGAAGVAGALGVRLAMEPNSLGDGEAGLPDADMAEPADDPMATADLAAEQNPPPQVEVREEPLDAREQAHALMKELNMRRRQAGGEIPEAPQMIRQIETLLAQADDAGNARMRQTMDGGPPSAAGPQDYHGQARDLIAQVNMMYRQGMTPNSPEAQRVMQEVRRLQSMGDAQRNAGTTAFPGRR
jgi:hypothetical protein